MVAILSLYAISASTFIISKSLLAYSSPFFLTGLRTVIAGLLFLLYFKARRQVFSSKILLPCLKIALFSFYLSNTFKFWSLKHITTSSAAIISTIEPLFAVIFSYLICSEGMNFSRWLGLLFCIGGSLMLSCSFKISELYIVGFFGLPEIILLLAIACSSYGAITMRSLVRTTQCSIVGVNGLSMMVAGILALGTSFMVEGTSFQLSSQTIIPFFFLLSIMIIVSNLFAYSMYGYLLKNYSAVLISSASFMRPCFTALYTGSVTASTLFASCIICIGLFFLYKEESSFKVPLAHN